MLLRNVEDAMNNLTKLPRASFVEHDRSRSSNSNYIRINSGTRWKKFRHKNACAQQFPIPSSSLPPLSVENPAFPFVMFARTLVLSLIAALATTVLAHETNADRFARGLTPLRPRRLFTSGHHVARTLPSGVACSNDALEGYIALRYTNGDGLLGYFNDDTSSCSSDSSKAAKFEYPDGCDTKTFIKRFGVDFMQNLYIGAVARSVDVVKSVVSDVSKLIFGRSESSSDAFCFTGSKMVSELCEQLYHLRMTDADCPQSRRRPK
ncbi:hypothetical protein CPB85DRAFT_668998 [Mucidula mucida]|nr:hypothetical protein CPB85DRAFT_668998 [Mucidula mucida]